MRLLLAHICMLLTLSLASCGMPGGGSAGNDDPVLAPQQATILVRVDQPGARVSPSMWGAFFEDINFGGDGGLYGEMVKNRGFEFPDAMMGWFKISPSMAKGDVTIETANAYRPTQTHYVRIASKATAPLGVSNEGFRGMGVTRGETYNFAAQIRSVEGNPRVNVQIVGEDGTLLASAPLQASASWSQATATLRPKDTDGNARIAIFVDGPGTVDLDFVSLFPARTWKGRTGGLRADMVQALADMHPGFLRFPGGCIVEGSDLSKRYQWKNTIGAVEDRKLLIDRWNYEFPWRPTPDYYQSFGLGFFEFFQLCEDIGANPLALVNAGMACQFNSGELCPMDQLQPYIQDALDLIEFANGPAESTWGRKRAEMGHPAPFNPPLTMLGVGNEQWGPQYIERLTAFTRAIKAKYPEVQIVSAAGPGPADDRFEYLWPALQKLNVDGHKADIVDQHCYANPIWFLANSTRFDAYDRSGPKIFFGEYAAQSEAICSTKNRNNLECALAEAAYMTGLERNADVVRMASYAPLYANTQAWQWTPDLIWADSLQAVPSVNYYVQQMYCMNRGDAVLPTSNSAPVAERPWSGRVGLGTTNCAGEFKDVQIVGADGKVILSSASDPNGRSWNLGDTWKTTGGVFQQGNAGGAGMIFAGSKGWRDYTFSAKVRRTAGSGPILVNVCDDDTHAAASRVQWILGAPVGNLTVADPGKPEFILQTHLAEQDSLIQHVPGSLEVNRWYDVQLSVRGDHVECKLDGKVVHSAEVPHVRVPGLFTSATKDGATGETILKVVNPGAAATVAQVQLQGAANTGWIATVTTLAGKPADEDNLATPAAVVPRKEKVAVSGSAFSYTFKPHSFTILRLPTGK